MFDLIIRNANCVSASETFRADIGVRGGKIAELGRIPGPAERQIDAQGRYVLPGGIDSHVHVDQRKAHGRINADDFASGSRSAACGGTTTMIPFAPQYRGQSLRWVIEDYHARAQRSVVDYNFHLIVTDPAEPDFQRDLADAASSGLRSLKVFTTYAAVGIGDPELLAIFAAARRHGFLIMAHCENSAMIEQVTRVLLQQGRTQAKYHLASRPTIAEAEAAFRITAMAELHNVPVMIVHVSSGRTLEVVELAKRRGATVFVETCTQYLTLEQSRIDIPGPDAAKWVFSPPIRDATNREAIWDAVSKGDVDVLSSDHAPYMLNETGKFPEGFDSSFDKIASGVPGVGARMPILFTECVSSGRVDLPAFVRLTAANAARIYGIDARKGDIAIGMDADFCIWDDAYDRVITNDIMHHQVDFTPYEGYRVRAWPAVTISRGEVIARYHDYLGEADRGQFIPAQQTPVLHQETQAQAELGAFGATLEV
jgi:dihydropyrimidinase